MLRLIIFLLYWVLSTMYSHVAKQHLVSTIDPFPFASRKILTYIPAYLYNITGSPGSIGVIIFVYMIYRKFDTYKNETFLFFLLCVGKLVDYILRGSSKIYVPFSDFVLTYDLIAMSIFGGCILRLLILKNLVTFSQLRE